MDLALIEVSKSFITIKKEDFTRSQEVFKTVFGLIKKKMEEQCNFFKTYSSQIMYGGSVADDLKVSKLDEFDMDIVIRLPINYNQGTDGITIENDQPGFVKMKINNAFDYLDKQQHWESRHKVTRDWRDSDKYFLQNKFRNWLQGIIQKAINDMNMQAEVDGVRFLLTYKESGPAYTLNIRNDVGNEPFALDVDIVPVIKFHWPRWPHGYRPMKNIGPKAWYVVPKPNKYATNSIQKNRCWRLSFQDYERDLIKGCKFLKSSIKLVKKLRDALGMKAIASYYIKTLFLWKVSKVDKTYWENKPSVIFRDMVNDFYDAVKIKKISYFWHEENNFIENLKPTLQGIYADKLKVVLNAIVDNDVKTVVKSLLTKDEHKEFMNSDFYKIILVKQTSMESSISLDISEQIISLKDEIDSERDRMDSSEYTRLEKKVNDLSDRLADVEDRVRRIEIGMQNKLLDCLHQVTMASAKMCLKSTYNEDRENQH